MTINSLLILLMSFSVMYSCGRKIEQSAAQGIGDRTPDRNTDPRVDLNRFIKKQKLICEDVLFCPDNVAKLVVVENNRIRYCTGTLIDSKRMITSASCLFKSLRIPNLSCSKNVFAIFPENIYGDEEKAGCSKIEYVDSNQFQEAALWQSDIAIIELDREITTRKISKFTTKGPRDGDSLISWKVDFETDFLGVLRQDKCSTILNTYLNPFSSNRNSPMLVTTDCDFSDSNIGTPLFRGEKIAAIFSQEMSHRIYNYLASGNLIDGEIGRYYHATNTVCSNVVNNVLSSVEPPANCIVQTSVGQLDLMRSKILKNKSVHQRNMQKIKRELEKEKKYFNWDIDFIGDNRSTKFEAHFNFPKCIWRSNDWINEFRRWRSIRTYAKVSIERPHYVFTTKLDTKLRAVSIMENIGTKSYDVEFNPYEAFVNRNTYVTITTELHGNVFTENFEKVTTDCSR